ncbi:translation elongation factor Ts [Fodinicola feengrottensis]|uniref:Elongation factor Ts n=1 Tax=Fodinicola feengrottensis TaxID=435914 RepID=A0ABP4T550_9ACTN
MANFTAADVKKLRDATGAGMMDAKRALEEVDGDFDKGIELLRVKGAAKVAKRAERTAGNGLVAAVDGAMIQLACETDFVAKNEQFQQMAADIAGVAWAGKPADLPALLALELSDGKTVAAEIDSAAATIGEKLELAKLAVFDGKVAAYLHRRNSDLPPQVGVLIEFTGDDAETARSIAMHIAAMRPRFVTRDEIPADLVESERRIAEATAREEGKPEGALPKIVEGRVTGFYKEVVLLEQSFARDQKKTVKQVAEEAGLTVTRFARFEAGQA